MAEYDLPQGEVSKLNKKAKEFVPRPCHKSDNEVSSAMVEEDHFSEVSSGVEFYFADSQKCLGFSSYETENEADNEETPATTDDESEVSEPEVGLRRSTRHHVAPRLLTYDMLG